MTRINPSPGHSAPLTSAFRTAKDRQGRELCLSLRPSKPMSLGDGWPAGLTLRLSLPSGASCKSILIPTARNKGRNILDKISLSLPRVDTAVCTTTSNIDLAALKLCLENVTNVFVAAANVTNLERRVPTRQTESRLG
ncbi:hypothetical protein RRG08_051653 [Elysia crispata]|uniref:Uncharacterized protein n=1 Tax=Elysia crispata TaxID=231223 RepID=A0AAE1A318_9GAST|nr:hypothetical protein RRG08_051653 [Elysia crispata]